MNFSLAHYLKEKTELNNEELWNKLIQTNYDRYIQILPEISSLLNIELKTNETLTVNKNIANKNKIKQYLEKQEIPIYTHNNITYIVSTTPFTQNTNITYLMQRDHFYHLWFSLFKTEKDTWLTFILSLGIKEKASDIHLYTTKKNTKVWFRINGSLIYKLSILPDDAKVLTAIIKLNAHMKTDKHTEPQDGRLTYENTDIRIATLPTLYGEDIVCRLLKQTTKTKEITELGFSLKIERELKNQLNKTAGLLLVTGSTGSGKSTTLYTFLSYMQTQKQKQNIITLEDPIEKIIPGIRQSQTQNENNYTFSTGLKSILRQDPDVIMIGEIRDKETAKIALDAAYTGHLVLSTLHTDSCESTLNRLKSFQLDPFLIQHALKGIISQTLIPTLCKSCKSNGCKACNYTGIENRTIIADIQLFKNGKIYMQEKKEDALNKKIKEGLIHPNYGNTNTNIN